MTANYKSSNTFLLRRIGLAPSKKLLAFLITAILATLPVGYAYNSVAIVLFVLYSFLSYRKQDISGAYVLLMPIALYLLMGASVIWSIDTHGTVRALSKEAALFFIPLAFFFNKKIINISRRTILKSFSIIMCFFAFVYFARAVVRFAETSDVGVFFHNELSSPVVSALYLSAIFSIAYFYFLSVKNKRFFDYVGLIVVAAILSLLLVKTVIAINIVLTAVYVVFFSRVPVRIRIAGGIFFLLLTGTFMYVAKTTTLFPAEYTANIPEMEALANEKLVMHNVTPVEAWTKERFNENDYFNGTAFRIYQARVFKELLQEDGIALTGYGLNASIKKIGEKSVEHNVFEGGTLNQRYARQNYHNQYIEVFSDLGIAGLLLVLAMLFINLKKSLEAKDFVHIAFAFLMIALLLTESFLWRQRGVVLFTLLYCLFNIKLPEKAERQNYEENTHNGGSRFSGVTPLR
jgi:hypothetical protein